jgi:C-terminal processing protease CtpA/Prc
MRQPFLIVLCALNTVAAMPFTRQHASQQLPSNPTVAERVLPARLTPDQVESLILLGRVWGFAKYHHPRVTSGAVDWDAELRRAIPTVVNARTPAAARDTIDRWLAALGDPPACTSCATLPAQAVLVPDIGWIRNERLLGHSLSARLQRIYANRSAAPAQRYVQFAPEIGNPRFTDENAFTADSLPPADLRLLGVFRFWNILEYWFPYRDLMEHDRVRILRDFVPAAWEVHGIADYHRTMMQLVARAHDSHANLWSSMAFRPPTGTYGVPVVVRWVEGQFVVAGFSHDSAGPLTGLRRGDVILCVDGVPVDSLVAARSPYIGASNDASRRRDIARALLAGDSGTVRLDIERDGAQRTETPRRMLIAKLDRTPDMAHDRLRSTFQMLSPDVAYLKLSTVVASDVPGYISTASSAKVLVIDIRNYPNEFVVFELGGHLMADVHPFAKFSMGDPANPGLFRWTGPVSIPPMSPRFMGKVVILVDEISQSQAEYTTMAFRTAPGAIVVGSTTAGADGNVSAIPLPGGLRGMISGLGVFYPDGRPTQQVGIIPDLEVRPTIAGIRSGRDEVLEAGVSRALGRKFELTP